MHNLLLTLFLFLGCLSLHGQDKPKKSESPANNALILFDAFSRDTSLTKGWGFSSLIEYNGKRIYLMPEATQICFNKT